MPRVLGVLALTTRILLLLSGFLSATLLLPRLLTRVLVLLARVLVLVGHSESPLLDVTGANEQPGSLVASGTRFQGDASVAKACCDRDGGTRLKTSSVEN